jgi:cation transport ATPase
MRRAVRVDVVPNEETEAERLDRELEELLQELRLALPGVQILFAFLLVVPFNNRFRETDPAQRAVWFVALLFALGAVGCLIAPTAYHRIRFRDFDKEWLVTMGTRLALAGLVCLATALAASAFFVVGFVYGDELAGAVAAAAAAALGGLWFGLPITRAVIRGERDRTPNA